MTETAEKIGDLYRTALSSIEEVVEEARRGNMFILVDDEDRENEGDLCIQPDGDARGDQFHGQARSRSDRLSMERDRIEKLGLPLMSANNGTQYKLLYRVH